MGGFEEYHLRNEVICYVFCHHKELDDDCLGIDVECRHFDMNFSIPHWQKVEDFQDIYDRYRDSAMNFDSFIDAMTCRNPGAKVLFNSVELASKTVERLVEFRDPNSYLIEYE